MDLDPKLLARYANWFNIGHNSFEFILDFGQCHPEASQTEASQEVVHTRIVLGPAYAKVLGGMLSESLGRYEAEFGRIPDVAD